MTKLRMSFASDSELLARKSPVRVLGIDLGTTNSIAAEMVLHPDGDKKQAHLHCLPVIQETLNCSIESPILPSAVARAENKTWVGEGARQLRAQAGALGLVAERDYFFECKNDMGLKRTYANAPEGMRNAVEVSAQILKTLYQAALAVNPEPPERVVVTIPSSFQIAQRRDTIQAAKLAGIELGPGDLLDEPVAVFIDYLFRYGTDRLQALEDRTKLLVVDFGGGTCDVAILQLDWADDPARPGISPLAVSRFHRLGGGDIDRAILYELLLPELQRQNPELADELDYEIKKQCIEPALLHVAEAIKIEISQKVKSLQAAGEWHRVSPARLQAKLPDDYSFKLKGRDVKLSSPAVSYVDFIQVVNPFLDRDILLNCETEYRLSQSVFAPLQDALERAELSPREIGVVLLAGGSTLIPPVAAAIANYLPNAIHLTFDSPNAIQTAVARGAAIHGFHRLVTGTPLVAPVCPDLIALRTEGGSLPIIQRGARLPACGGKAEELRLAVPETIIYDDANLLVEVVCGRDERVIFTQHWRLPDQVYPGDPLKLTWNMDENQVLRVNLSLAGHPCAQHFSCEIDNPLTHVVNPSVVRAKIDAREEELRNHKFAGAERPAATVELARWCAEIGQREKAISLLKRSLEQGYGDQSEAFNLMGIYAGELGDAKLQRKYYERAMVANKDGMPLFNLALACRRSGKDDEALRLIDQAIERGNDAPYWVLKAQLSHDANDRTKCLKAAWDSFAPIPSQSDWSLGWYISAAKMLEDEPAIEAAEAEQLARRSKSKYLRPQTGVLPALIKESRQNS